MSYALLMKILLKISHKFYIVLLYMVLIIGRNVIEAYIDCHKNLVNDKFSDFLIQATLLF